MGYDDAETLALKKGYANNRCLGGTMIWSVDFDSGVGRYVYIPLVATFIHSDCPMASKIRKLTEIFIKFTVEIYQLLATIRLLNMQL